MDTTTRTAGKKRFFYLSPITIIGALFFIFGFVTWLNSVLIPYLRIACELNNFESYLVAFAFYIAYFVMALPSSWVIRRFGYKKGMAIGLGIMAVGAVIFIPAAMTRVYGLFLTGLFVQGTGLALLQTASNPYITILGPRESAAKRISIMGICNKVAGAIAPIVLGAVTLKDADAITARLLTLDPIEKAGLLDSLASRVIWPYLVIVATLAALALYLLFSRLPEIDIDDKRAAEVAPENRTRGLLHFPHLVLGVIALFLYVGAEVISGDTIIAYGSFQGIELSTAKFFTTCTLSAMIVGYVIGIVLIPKYLAQQKALLACSITGLMFTILALVTNGYLSVLFIALLGLANSLVWPAIWPLALEGLGKLTKTGSSLLIMSIAGGALLPLVYGKLADMLNPKYAYAMLLVCYAFLLYYAAAGYRLRSRTRNPG